MSEKKRKTIEELNLEEEELLLQQQENIQSAIDDLRALRERMLRRRIR